MNVVNYSENVETGKMFSFWDVIWHKHVFALDSMHFIANKQIEEFNIKKFSFLLKCSQLIMKLDSSNNTQATK